MTTSLADRAPAFALRGADDVVHTLDDYADAQALVLVQACNHCPFVQAWEGRIDALAAGYAARGVRVVLVNSNDVATQPEDSFELMQARVRERGSRYDYLHDPEQTLARALGAERTPEAFVFDAVRRRVYHGAIDDSRDDGAVTAHWLRDALDALLAGAPVEPAETPVLGCTIKWRG